MVSDDFGPPLGGRANGEQHRPAHGAQPSRQEHRPAAGRQQFLDVSVGTADQSGTAGTAPTYETGTTIVALTAEEGVVMAADRRMSLGGRFTANKNVDKLAQVHPTAALAISGAVGPAQTVQESLRAEASLYESRRGEPMSTTALAQTAGHVVRGAPVSPLLGGVDDAGAHVYELDGGGSVLEDSYAAGGSGMQVAYGVLEGRFDPDASLDGARETAAAAVAAASERDTASGDGVTVATITDEGVNVEVASDSGSGGDGTAGDRDGDDAADSGEVR